MDATFVGYFLLINSHSNQAMYVLNYQNSCQTLAGGLLPVSFSHKTSTEGEREERVLSGAAAQAF